MGNLCDPMCAGCIYSIATPLMFKDCEKCKSMLKEAPDKHGYFYFDKEGEKEKIVNSRNQEV